MLLASEMLILVCAGVLYMVAPDEGSTLNQAMNVILIAVFVDAPLATILRGLLRAYGWMILGCLVTEPLVGLGTLRTASCQLVRVPAVPQRRLSSTASCARWCGRWGCRPRSRCTSRFSFGGNVVLVAVIAYVMQRDFRAP